MKKFAAIILLLLYSSANFGLALRLDYCGDSLSDIGFYAAEKELAECCRMLEIPEDCCSSEQVFLQDESDKAFSANTLQTVDFGLLAGVELYPSLPIKIYPSAGQEFVIQHAPPLLKGSQSRLCVFRI